MLGSWSGSYTERMARVLIIDSDDAVAETLQSVLVAKGVEAETTGDGGQGLTLARSVPPDAIVLCVELSRVSGYSICNKLKKDPTLQKIPLILTSSQATEETFEQHKKLKTRAEAYLKKPYQNPEILELIGQYVDLSAPRVDLPLEPTDSEMVLDTGGPGSSSDIASANETAPSRASRRSQGGSAAGDAGREELKQLRQKVLGLERQLQEKELEFNDRLLQESTRAREALEYKKKVTLVERDLAKYEQAADKARAEAKESRHEAATLREDLRASEQERQALSDKLGELVDKVKSLAVERNSLREKLGRMESENRDMSDQLETSAQMREKARKAVDIAVQLLEETGLVEEHLQ